MKKNIRSSVIFTFVFLCASSSHAFDLSNTLFEKYGSQLGLDPKLIYSVALAESARANSSRNLGPHPWTLRSDRAFYKTTKKEAEDTLQLLLKQTSSIDIGLMQVNFRWHGEKVSSPKDLLDPEINMRVGASYLHEMISSTPHDLELAIGKYHVGPSITPDNFDRAKNYGKRVLAIYKNILDLSR